MKKLLFIVAALLFGIFYTCPIATVCGGELIGFPLAFLQTSGHYVDEFKTKSPPGVQWPSVAIFNPKILFLDVLVLALIGSVLFWIFRREWITKTRWSYLPTSLGLYWIITMIMNSMLWLYGLSPQICYASDAFAAGLYNLWHVPSGFVLEFLINPIYDLISYKARMRMIHALQAYPPLSAAFPTKMAQSLAELISFPVYIFVFSQLLHYFFRWWDKEKTQR